VKNLERTFIMFVSIKFMNKEGRGKNGFDIFTRQYKTGRLFEIAMQTR
jgi:hypothetical protein